MNFRLDEMNEKGRQNKKNVKIEIVKRIEKMLKIALVEQIQLTTDELTDQWHVSRAFVVSAFRFLYGDDRQ